MSGADNAKKLLTEYNHAYYRAFTLNSDATLVLPQISSVPWVGASKRSDIYRKKCSHLEQDNHVKFITKNHEPHAFIWQTNAQQLKKAARWGIVKTHSITGQVIASLGQYRVVAHGRIAKGMESNSQAVKLKLLDLFQDRFEALQDVESLVNKANTIEDYNNILQQYIQKLEAISENLDNYFADVNLSGLDDNSKRQIKSDIQADIERTIVYSSSMQDSDSFRSYKRARGQHSIMEFVKEQMIHGLYELQGINQDISYSNQRFFALTRGELNDFIEDARKNIDDHQADLRNAVTARHHGLYSADKDELVSYDFSNDELSPAREREVLLAISFIEGWDELSNSKDKQPIVTNKKTNQKEELDIVTATRWKTHRNLTALFRSVGFYILAIFKGMFVSTRPWDEESWVNKKFQLVATELRKHAKPNEPLWRKPLRFLKQIYDAIIDIFNGVYNFGAELVIRMPLDVVNDWESSQELVSLDNTITVASEALDAIRLKEDACLETVLEKCTDRPNKSATSSESKLASVEYELSAGDQNDILTAMARGLNGFGSIFSHTIYAKDPVAGLFFTAAFAVGVGVIYLPSLTSSVFGAGYVDWFSKFSYSMGSSKLAASIAGGSSQAEVFATGWDSIAHGPSGLATSALYQTGEDPLTAGAYLAAAYGLGYLLANGIGGHTIPWLSEHLKADLGAIPEAGYPIIGAKVAIMLYEGLMTEHAEDDNQQVLSTLNYSPSPFDEAQKLMIARCRLIHWLSSNAAQLPKLEPRQLLAISRQINTLFSKEESKSLHKLLYPESQSSIAFELLYIPLSYIPALLRVGVSLILSLAAWVAGNPYPMEPLSRAATQLIDSAKKDLSRLIIFATFLMSAPYTMLTTFIKMPVVLLVLVIGRIAGLFNAKPAHFLYGAIAAVHAFSRSVGEFLFPARALKDVAVAHPTHTIKECEDSYAKLMAQIGESVKLLADNSTLSDTHAIPLFAAAKEPVKTVSLNEFDNIHVSIV